MTFSIPLLSITILSETSLNTEYPLCRVSFMLRVVNKPIIQGAVMLSVIMLSVIMLSVIMVSIIMVSVIMLSVIMLSFIMLNAFMPVTNAVAC
jgi:hypothetical protein